MSRILVHACCAHCLGKLLTALREDSADWQPLIFWGNPNIHPLLEWRRRLKAVKMLAERARLPLVADETYGLVAFLREVHGPRGSARALRTLLCLAVGAGGAGRPRT